MSDSERMVFAATTALLAAVLVLAGLLLLRNLMIIGVPLTALGVLGLAHSVLVGTGAVSVRQSRATDEGEPPPRDR